MNKFWKFENSITSEGADLYLEGDISQVTWYGDEVTPSAFRTELKKCKGDITVHIDSNGGDVFAGVTIYNALKDYSRGKVIVKVDGIAASIASVIAMSGDEIVMSPGSMMMIHNPWSMGAGSSEELRKTADLLDEIRDTIVPIYAERTGLSEEEVIDIMDSETWMSAEKAVEKGFADKVMKKKECNNAKNLLSNGAFAFNMSATKNAMVDLIKKVNNKGETSMGKKLEEVKAEAEIKVAEEVEITTVNEDGTAEAVVDGEDATIVLDEEAKEAIEEAEAEEKSEEAEAKEEVEKAEEDGKEEAEETAETEESTEETEEEAEEKDEIGEAIKALKDENAELKAKLEELTKAKAKAQAKVNSLENLKAHYASILNMAEEADGGDVSGKEDDNTVDNTYENALKEAFKS